ncbi:MAG TPA: Rpn family recombination-promoting nuclease/putative transposase [Arachidicoccus sp.]|nr:Rpn family recombination-promoting nuclease/putative transposase [Arachidicoccus sp.]
MNMYISSGGTLCLNEPSKSGRYIKQPQKPPSKHSEKEIYINPLTDFGWKKLFGTQTTTKYLISLLNSILEGKEVITEITIKSAEIQGPGVKKRKAIYDILCVDQNGTYYQIEMQREKQNNYWDRLIYYQQTLGAELGIKGRDWDYDVVKIYTISFVDFNLRPEITARNIHQVGNCYFLDPMQVTEKNNIILVEIPKIRKPEHELKTMLDNWIFLLQNMKALEKIPAAFKGIKLFRDFFKASLIFNLTTEERMIYNDGLKAERDYNNLMNTKLQEGERIGEKKGEKKGERKGERNARKALIMSLLRNSGHTPEEIANFTNVNLQIVKQINKELQKVSTAEA